MLAFHSYWTGPLQGRQPELWDFEWLTWLGSILAMRQHVSGMVLVTDPAGEVYVKKTGLAQFYDQIVQTAKLVPPVVDPRLFWAAGKLYAAKQLADLRMEPHGNMVSVDLDCIPWVIGTGATPRGHFVKVLNRESLSWTWYQGIEDKYNDMFVGKKVNWKLAPVNSGFVQFQCARHFKSYASKATDFIERFSRKMAKDRVMNTSYFNDAMMFAEQFLLPVWAEDNGYEVRPLLTCRNDGFLPINDFVTHLWTSKMFYKAFPEARTHYVNELVKCLLPMDDRVAGVLKQRGLYKSQELQLTSVENHKVNRQNAHALHRKYPTLSYVTLLEGAAWLRDRNVGGKRKLQVGSVLLPGDKLILDDHTRIQLDLPVLAEYLS